MKNIMSFRKFLTFILVLFLMQTLFSAERKVIGKLSKYPYIDRFSFQLGREYPFNPQYDREIPAMGFFIFGLEDISEYTVKWKYGYIAPLRFSTFCPVFGSCGGGFIGGAIIPVSETDEFQIGVRLGFSPVYFLFDVTPHIMFMHRLDSGKWYYGIGVNTHLMFFDSLDVICVFIYFKIGF